MIWIAELTFCGGISRIIFCPMILCLDGEVVWSNLDHYRFSHLFKNFLELASDVGSPDKGLGLLEAFEITVAG